MYVYRVYTQGDLAQLVERFICIEEVGSSTLPVSILGGCVGTVDESDLGSGALASVRVQISPSLY